MQDACEKLVPNTPSERQTALKIFAITMSRNDADIAPCFMAQAEELFDKLFVIDVQSTDGTKEIIQSKAESGSKVELYTVETQEKYQSALMNCLARKAFHEGADWIFLLDLDEIINVESRDKLEAYLKLFSANVMYLRWINLVPTVYGTFTSFDSSQDFYWRGRTSQYRKIALSSLFVANNPDFYIHEGNHDVSQSTSSGAVELGQDGLTLLHLPVRSIDRFKYKMLKARATLLSKHNRQPGEGSHVLEICDLMESGRTFTTRNLDPIAADYGDRELLPAVDPAADGWPIIRLGGHAVPGPTEATQIASLTETLLRDKKLRWLKAEFPEGSAVGATLRGSLLVIRPQAMKGDGSAARETFAALPERVAATCRRPGLLVDAVSAALTKIDFLAFSAWSELIPTLFCIFVINRPRRFVELGTHNGVCFFAACQISKSNDLATECVAVDNWVGDPHASFHSKEIFENFASNIRRYYPSQYYIRSNFDQALSCFDPGSIDLLHIDGYHTYAAVRHDFETWLPMMSDEGVIMFHDINVHGREFGVWRFWSELEEKYPSFSVHHSHGLGIICLGKVPTALSELISLINDVPEVQKALRVFLQESGKLSVDHKTCTGDLEEVRRTAEHLRVLADDRYADLTRIVDENARLHQVVQRLDAEKLHLASCMSALLESIVSGLSTEMAVKTVQESGFFDADFYLQEYPDVAKDGVDPIMHYMRYGAGEGRRPSAGLSGRRPAK